MAAAPKPVREAAALAGVLLGCSVALYAWADSQDAWAGRELDLAAGAYSGTASAVLNSLDATTLVIERHLSARPWEAIAKDFAIHQILVETDVRQTAADEIRVIDPAGNVLASSAAFMPEGRVADSAPLSLLEGGTALVALSSERMPDGRSTVLVSRRRTAPGGSFDGILQVRLSPGALATVDAALGGYGAVTFGIVSAGGDVILAPSGGLDLAAAVDAARAHPSAPAISRAHGSTVATAPIPGWSAVAVAQAGQAHPGLRGLSLALTMALAVGASAAALLWSSLSMRRAARENAARADAMAARVAAMVETRAATDAIAVKALKNAVSATIVRLIASRTSHDILRLCYSGFASVADAEASMDVADTQRHLSRLFAIVTGIADRSRGIAANEWSLDPGEARIDLREALALASAVLLEVPGKVAVTVVEEGDLDGLEAPPGHLALILYCFAHSIFWVPDRETRIVATVTADPPVRHGEGGVREVRIALSAEDPTALQGRRRVAEITGFQEDAGGISAKSAEVLAAGIGARISSALGENKAMALVLHLTGGVAP